MQKIVGKAGLFGKTLWGKVVCISSAGDSLDCDKAFCHKVSDIGVHKPQCNAEAAAEVPLCQGVIGGKLGEYLQRTALLRVRNSVHTMNVNTGESINSRLFAGELCYHYF